MTDEVRQHRLRALQRGHAREKGLVPARPLRVGDARLHVELDLVETRDEVAQRLARHRPL